MTLKTKSAITSEISTNLATNGAGAITATLLSQVVQDMVDSYLDWTAGGALTFSVTGVNFNSANTDNSIAITLPTGKTRYQVSECIISNASHTLVTATAGLFTAASGGGVAIVTAASTITVSATTDATLNNSQSMTINNSGTESYTAGTLFFRVAAAEGATATGDVTVRIRPLP